MPGHDDSDTIRPKVALALPDDALRRRVLDVLENLDVDVEILDSRQELADHVQETEGDVVLVGGASIDPSDLDALVGTDSDEPSVAVIGEDDPAIRAQLLAAGATRVLSGEEPHEHLASSLEDLAVAEAAGGPSGPEVGGVVAQPRLADFLTQSPRMREFIDLVRKVVPVDTSLLITGPTGVGKERLARAIHAEGPRARGPFVAVNCAALPEHLLESGLFGHEKGAFTGADRHRQGSFELASGGTIFLDEIGEMPPHLQVKLLTVLQRHEVTLVGSGTPVKVDVRVMAATNRDLEEEVAAKRFRADLFYRLNVLTLYVPPLRDRPEDVADLAGRFVKHFREVMPTSQADRISERAIEALMAYPWPGNVRELVNVIERAMLLCRTSEISLSDLPVAIARHDPCGASAERSGTGDPERREECPEEWLELPLREVRELAIRRAETAYLRGVLARAKGRVGRAAEISGVGVRALYEKLRRYDLKKEEFRD